GLLTTTAAVQATGGVAFSFFSGRGDLNVFLTLGLLVSVANIAVSVGLTEVIGIAGPAVGTLAAVVVFDLVILPRRLAASLGRGTRELLGPLGQMLGPPLGLSAATAVA